MFLPSRLRFVSGLGAGVFLLACSASDSASGPGPAASGQDSGAEDGAVSAPGDAGATLPDADGGSNRPDAGAARSPDAGAARSPDAGAVRSPDAGSPRAADGGSGSPVGWLYTRGSKIYVSNGSAAGTPWVGRGVNFDDIYLCGYNFDLSLASPEQTLESMASVLMSAWKPTFVRVSLGMNSHPKAVSWLTGAAQYKTPMTNVIDAIGAHPNTYVLVTLRSDVSMIGQDMVDGDPEATGLPSDSTTTPDRSASPTGTDATYIALVDTFASSSFVLFGLTNEPGGNKLPNDQIAAAMNHAVGVIRAEEDRLGAPHHLVSVQGNGWTGDISFYATSPLAYDNVVYEVHGYPPPTAAYTFANLPVILGEYGSLTSGASASFYADVEAKQIPNLAWDFDSFSDCAPDLLNVNQSATNLTASPWGAIVQAYLLAHAN